MASQPRGSKDHLRCDLNKGIFRKKSLMAEVILSMTGWMQGLAMVMYRQASGSKHCYKNWMDYNTTTSSRLRFKP